MWGCELVVSQADDQTKDEIAAEPEHHGVSTAEAVAEEGAEEDAGEGEGTEEKLPFAGFLDVGGFGDGGDDLAGEDAVGEGDEVVAGDVLAVVVFQEYQTRTKSILLRWGGEIRTGTKHHRFRLMSSSST